jgi:hypothetical protein
MTKLKMALLLAGCFIFLLIIIFISENEKNGSRKVVQFPVYENITILQLRLLIGNSEPKITIRLCTTGTRPMIAIFLLVLSIKLSIPSRCHRIMAMIGSHRMAVRIL